MLVKRSLRLSGHATSLALEPEFWDAVQAVAASRGQTTDQLIADIDGQRRGPSSNLSSAVRVYLLRHYRTRADQSGGGASPDDASGAGPNCSVRPSATRPAT